MTKGAYKPFKGLNSVWSLYFSSVIYIHSFIKVYMIWF